MNTFSKKRLLGLINNILIDHKITMKEVHKDLGDFGVDSITFIKIIVLIEDSFEIEIPDSKLIYSELNTFNKIYETILPLIKDSR